MAADDLVNHFKLEAHVALPHTSHFTYKRSRLTGQREKVVTKWERIERIGRGGFSEVWKEINHRSDGSRDARAVKIVDKQQMKSVGVDYRKEILALAKFSKEEYRQADVLVSFLGWFETDESVFFAMEYLEYGSLAQHTRDVTTEDHVRQIATDLLEGLNIMHSELFAHRDLKPQNIFVVQKPPSSDRWCVKLGDFGISKRIKDGATMLHTQTGTPYFQAPEIIGFVENHSKAFDHSVAVDLWSLGCVLYYISTGKVPFSPILRIVEFCQARLPFPEEPLRPMMNENGIEFVRRLLVPQPVERMTVKQGLQDQWILNSSQPSSHEPAPVSTEPHALARIDAKSDSDTKEHRQQNDHDQHILSKDHLSDASHPLIQQAQNISLDVEAKGESLLSEDATLLSVGSASSPKAVSEVPTATDSIQSNRANLQSSSASPSAHRSRDNVSNDTKTAQDIGSTATNTVGVIPSSTSLTRIKWTKSKVFAKHEEMVYSVAISPNGRTIVSGSKDKTIYVWDVTTGRCLLKFTGHLGWVYSVAFSPDGSMIASGSEDMTVRLWDVVTQQCLGTFVGHSDIVWSVTFSPDGSMIASGSEDKTVRIWDVTTRQHLYTLGGHAGAVLSVAFSHDGSMIASGSRDKTIRLWKVATRQYLCRLTGHSDWVRSVTFSHDGSMIVSGSADTTVRLWNVVTQQCLHIFKGHSDWVWSVAFSHDSSTIASGSGDKRIRVWDVTAKQCSFILKGHSARVTAVVFSPDSTKIISGSHDHTIRFWGDIGEQNAETSNKESFVSRFKKAFQ